MIFHLPGNEVGDVFERRLAAFLVMIEPRLDADDLERFELVTNGLHERLLKLCSGGTELANADSPPPRQWEEGERRDEERGGGRAQPAGWSMVDDLVTG